MTGAALCCWAPYTAGMAAAGLEITDFVDVGIECTLRQLLEHGFFHADPHPGGAAVGAVHALHAG